MTSGGAPPADLARMFFLQLCVIGSTMGTREEFERMLTLLGGSQRGPLIDRVIELGEARAGLAAMHAGELLGKIVLRP